MPSFPGNTRIVYAARQASKGTAAVTPTHKFTLAGDAAMDPGRSIIQLPETDASAQQANNVVVGSRPTGGWSGWCRVSEFAWLAHMLLGNNVDSGTNPFTHVATPVQNIPYVTLWDVVPGSMCTKYVDSRISSLKVEGEALAGLQYEIEAVALSALLNEAEPTLPTNPASDAALAYPAVEIRVGGVQPFTHDSFELMINRNVSVLAGDLGMAAYDSVVGLFEVEGKLTRIYESDDQYNEFHGGSAAATALVSTIFAQAFELRMVSGTHRIEFDSELIEYTETAIPVNVDGTPVIYERSFRTQRRPTIAGNMTITTVNALATSLTSPT